MKKSNFPVLMLLMSMLFGCQSLPDSRDRLTSFKRTDVQDTPLSQSAARFLAGLATTADQVPISAFYPLSSGADALSARLELVEAAEKTLDLQYYIWHRDASGRMLAALLIRAADRGVRVRLLLDDMGAPLGDDTLLTLHMHPNIEIRLFNPLHYRSSRGLAMLTDFSRVNRRMHNKSLTADNSVAMVGGRNIGNEYFAAHNEVAFADLDVAITGPVVDQVSDGFDLYWNHPASYAMDQLAAAGDAVNRFEGRRQALDDYADRAHQREFFGQLLAWHPGSDSDPEGWFAGRAQVLYDHPDKALDADMDDAKLLSTQLSGTFAEVRTELLLVSPYFVPGKAGVQYFADLEAQGVDVTIVTNSLAATDVGMVHSGYAKYRKALLRAGVELYEMRPDLARQAALDAQSDDSKAPNKAPKVGSSSKASLHAKAFFIDRHSTFVGSMNLDPRSFLINTEIGVLLESPVFTELAHATIVQALPQDAYRLQLDAAGNLQWLSEESGLDAPVVYTSDPKVPWWRRASVWFLGLFPIESQL
ncbi:phospholipase D family protein [Ketobacter sp.]|uniref:phospholipase D family protein n=1 Tax=Ketobacter sp. TaxID=2083498 RepID=UPI0025BB56A5|nr:phospholipase D family protein [Ketobacter sp.]